MHHFTLEENPSRADLDVLAHGLTEHSLPFTGGVPGFVRTLAVFLRDPAGTIRGGASGVVNWSWFYVSAVWLDESLRGSGQGRALMERLEASARDAGCRQIHLDTLGFQAREFYESLGYQVFATLDDYPEGYQRIFLKKAL